MTDHWVAFLLAPLAFWVLVNGIDDVFIDIAALFSYVIRRYSKDPDERIPTEAELDAAPAPADGNFRGALEGT